MVLLYDLGIRMYALSIALASIFNPKAKEWILGRRGLLSRIENKVGTSDRETLWVHCASLGEFEMARPVMEGLKERDSSIRIVLTFFSPSGYRVRKDYSVADHVFYLPTDTESNARRFIKAIRPSTVIFVKYDLWLHYLQEAKRSGAHLIMIAAQFRPEQHYFRWYGTVGRTALKAFDRVFLIDEKSDRLLQTIKVSTGTVCGDPRYDRVMKVARTAGADLAMETFKADSKLVICGSTWKEDETLLAEAIRKFPKVKWVLAPHEAGETHLRQLESLLGNTVRYSRSGDNPETRVMLVDGVGFLSRLYRYADVAYVGGAFRTGLHNILEATAFGVPTIFGPDHSRFPDAGGMAAKNLAFSIRDQQELNDRLALLLCADRSDLRNRISEFMHSRTGASAAVLGYLKDR